MLKNLFKRNEDDDDSLGDGPNEESVSPRAAGRKNMFAGEGENSRKGVLIHDGKKYAVGLFWLVADEDNMDSALVKRRSTAVGADFYCQRTGIVSQQGFGRLSMGHRIGMASAGAFAADMLVGEWHGIFRADNGWWYLAVHGDAIAPDGDRFFTDEEEAFNHFKAQGESYRWPRSYAPQDWEIPSVAGELPLARLLDQSASTSLKPVSLDAIFAGRRNKFIAMIVFATLLSVFIGVSYLQSVITVNLPEPPPIVSRSELMIGAVRAPPRAQTMEDLIAGQRQNIPLASAVIAACGETMAQLIRPLPGWPLNLVACSSEQVTATWQKSPQGTVEMLMSNTGVFPPDATARIDGNRFVSTLKTASMREFNQQVTPLNRVNAVLLLNERFNNVGDLRLNFVQPPAIAPAPGAAAIRGAQEVAILPPPYLDLLLSTRASPQALAMFFNVPGLELQEVRWEVQQARWVFRAKVHLLKDG